MLIIDVETTGIDPRRHSIVSIGAVDFFNPRSQFYEECRIWDGAEIDKQALKRNGFEMEEITDLNKKSLECMVKEFVSWIRTVDDRVIAGQNVYFDREFVNLSLERYRIDFRFGKRIVDLHSIGYAHILGRGVEVDKKRMILIWTQIKFSIM